MKATETQYLGWWCEHCEVTNNSTYTVVVRYRTDPDYVDESISDGSWTYYTQDTMTPVNCYICPNCERTETGNPDIYQLWECGECETLYIEEEEAVECCK